jgi:hypothetical protein
LPQGHHEEYTILGQRLFSEPAGVWDTLSKSWPAILVTPVVPFVFYFVGILTIAKRDIYYDVDNRFVGKRKKIDEFICTRMLDFRIALQAADEKAIENLRANIKAKCRQIMTLFYAYIEKDDIVNPQLKNHAFTYWGDYFSNLMFVFWGVLIASATVIIFIVDYSFSYVRLGIWAAMIITIGLNIRAIRTGKVGRMLFQIPETQVNEIHRNAASALLADLRKEKFFEE